jgi:predicted ABC-type sugar transport system permease subunit
MKSQKLINRSKTVKIIRRIFSVLGMLLVTATLYAQDGNSGISAATTQVKSYFSTGTSLMYAIGAIVGLVGAVKVYKKWNDGDHDTGKVASSWFGSCIFLVVVSTVLKSFFGV